MSERTRNLVFVVAMVAMAAALTLVVMSGDQPEDRAARLGASIMCPVCQGESIVNSPSQMARDMMALIEERVAEGATDAAIVDEILSSYTGALLLDPPVSGPTLILWVAPFVALIAGIVIIVWWRRQPVVDDAPVAPRGRRAIGALGLVAVATAVVVLVGFSLQQREPAGGLVDTALTNPDEVSNQTLEAVIATNQNHPQIDGMRLDLANRYLREGEYSSAFKHYFDVAGSERASDDQVVEALIGLGWMAWDGNREVSTAIGLFDQALAIHPTSVEARYLKSRVLWCGSGNREESSSILTGLLTDPSLPEATRTTVNADLQAIQAGEECT